MEEISHGITESQIQIGAYLNPKQFATIDGNSNLIQIWDIDTLNVTSKTQWRPKEIENFI